MDSERLHILVASLADIIRSQEAAGREKDRLALPRDAGGGYAALYHRASISMGVIGWKAAQKADFLGLLDEIAINDVALDDSVSTKETRPDHEKWNVSLKSPAP